MLGSASWTARLIDDLTVVPAERAYAFHPNGVASTFVHLSGQTVRIVSGSFEYSVPLANIPIGSWYSPRDRNGMLLPLRLKRGVFTSLLYARSIDVKWLRR